MAMTSGLRRSFAVEVRSQLRGGGRPCVAPSTLPSIVACHFPSVFQIVALRFLRGFLGCVYTHVYRTAVGQVGQPAQSPTEQVLSNQKYNTMFNCFNSTVSHCRQLTVIMVVVTSLRIYVRLRGNTCCLVVPVSLRTNKQRTVFEFISKSHNYISKTFF